jgi:hypothetical protein
MIANPDAAFLLLLAGMTGVYIELCRPGWVLPGVGGGALAMFALASLVRTRDLAHSLHRSTALAAGIPFAALTIWLIAIALRARFNKRVLR